MTAGALSEENSEYLKWCGFALSDPKNREKSMVAKCQFWALSEENS